MRHRSLTIGERLYDWCSFIGLCIVMIIFSMIGAVFLFFTIGSGAKVWLDKIPN